MPKENAFHRYDRNHRRGDVVSCKVSRIISDIGLFVDLAEGVTGIVHLSDFDWAIKGEELISGYTVGQQIEVIILTIEPDLERVCLGIKQLKLRPDDEGGATPKAPLPIGPRQPKRPTLSAEVTPDK